MSEPSEKALFKLACRIFAETYRDLVARNQDKPQWRASLPALIDHVKFQNGAESAENRRNQWLAVARWHLKNRSAK